MSSKRDEYLETLWRLKEQGKDSLEDLKVVLDIPFEGPVLDELHRDGLATVDHGANVVRLTEEGSTCARELVRKHRLAERLLHDVLKVGTESVESEACTFEHLVAPQVVESICTLLGHPRTCPHGLPIPEGTCCKRSEATVSVAVVPLTKLAAGQAGRIAYLNCQNDVRLHRLNGLQIKPGVSVTLHQRYPSYVVECEGGMIAIDEAIAENICVWKEPEGGSGGDDDSETRSESTRKTRRFWQRGRR